MNFFKKGTWLVVLIVVFAVVGEGLTVWNYRQHVFSTADATTLANPEIIEAFFPQRFSGKVFPDQVARVTFSGKKMLHPYAANVLSVQPTMRNAQPVLLVMLRLSEKNKMMPGGIAPGTSCAVTIDTTIPVQKEEERK